MFGLIVIGFISIGLVFMPKHRREGFIGIGLLFFTGFLILGMNIIIAISLRSEIAEKAEFGLKSDPKVLVNGQITSVDSKQLLADLTKINGWYFTNKSNPETEFLISIISQEDTLDVILKRDSKNVEEYWTYLPKYNYELELDLLQTKTLNGLVGKK